MSLVKKIALLTPVEKLYKKEFSGLIEDVNNCSKSEEKKVEKKTYVQAILGEEKIPKIQEEIPFTKTSSSIQEL